jgi:hypothetical protein
MITNVEREQSIRCSALAGKSAVWTLDLKKKNGSAEHSSTLVYALNILCLPQQQTLLLVTLAPVGVDKGQA